MIDDVESLRQMSLDDLRSLWAELAPRRSPARSRHRLAREVAWLIQCRRYGDLDADTKRRLRTATRASTAAPAGRGPQTDAVAAGAVVPGSRLVRTWRGRDYEVLVRDDGRFDFQGDTFATLSAVARAITGTKWSGPRFFGLVRRTDRSR